MKFSVIHINNKGETVGYRSDVGWACDPAVAEVIGVELLGVVADGSLYIKLFFIYILSLI